MLSDPRQRDYAIRTLHGEAAGDPSLEAVAHVIRNRTLAGRYGGNTVDGVVLAKNQFEPWNRADHRSRMLALSPDSTAYKQYGDIVDRVWSGNVPDPTNGATHFYAPKAQAAEGRAAPKWATGEGQQIGAHVFYAPEGRVGRPGDAEGPPEAPSAMKTAFAGEKGVDPTIYNAQQTPEQQAPALSQQNVLGNGALNNPGKSWSDWGSTLAIAGAHLRDDPAVLASVLKAYGPDKDAEDYKFITGQDGQIFRTHARKGTIEPVTKAGRSQYDAAMDKDFAERNNKLITAGEKSRSTLRDLDAARELALNPHVYQGPLGEYAPGAKRFVEQIPVLRDLISTKGIKESEMLGVLANRTTLDIKNAAEGNLMPGALSDNDLKFLRSANFSLSNSREGNLEIIDYGRRMAQRQIEYDQLRQQYVNARGRLDEGFYRMASQRFAGKDLFTEQERAKHTGQSPSGQRPGIGSFDR